MNSRAMVDEPARTAVRRGTDQTLFVEAGAGTGKTRELVQRVVNLVAGGTPLSRLAAITFTEAAASELRDRFREELALASSVGDAAGNAGDPYTAFGPAEREKCGAALDELDAAAIQTLHAFAHSLLSQFPLEAGLPPEFSLRDEVSAAIAFEERWQTFIDSLLTDGGGDPSVARALIRAFSLGLSLGYLRSVAQRLHWDWDRVERMSIASEAPSQAHGRGILEDLEAAFDLRSMLRPGADQDRANLRLEALEDFRTSLRDTQRLLDQESDPDQR